MKEHIQSLISAEVGQQQTIVQVHQLLGSSGEGRVNFSEATVSTLPQLGVAHRAQKVICLVLLVLSVGLDLQTIDLLQNLGLFMEQELQGKFLLRFAQLSGTLDLFGLVESPSVELVSEDLEVLCFLGVHAAFDFVLVLDFLFVAQVRLLRLQLIVFVSALLAETVSCTTRKPGAHMALDLKGNRLALFVPHS